MNIPWPAIFVICGTLIAIVLVLALPMPRSWTKTRARADYKSTPTIFRDDDRYWYGGVFYNNADDPEVFVPKRYGFGWTINFGHPTGRLLMFGMLLLGLIVPLAVALLGVLFPGSIHPTGCHPSGCYPLQ